MSKMRFLTALKSGASVKNIALQFVQVLLEKSWEDNEVNLQMACDFVNDILAAIGLECSITPEQINDGWSYTWPMEQIQIYNFHYIEADFKKLEEFLREMCTLVKQQNEIFINEFQMLHTKQFIDEDEDFESPVEFLMQLVAVWCSVFKQLQKIEEIQKNKRFEEPFARINFQLLLGMHELRKIYRLDLHLLDAICNRLYWSALRGLFYRQTHEMIFSGLLEIFSKNYDLFYASSAQTINFFYEAFAVEIKSLTPLKLYKALQDMLLADVPEQQLNILLNFLIEPYMLQVYFTTFMTKKHYKWYDGITNKKIERIQQEALKFLTVLQSKLLSLDCFSREFMESILNMAFKTDQTTSYLACSLYITMMKRKFSDQIILKHIMDFYAAHVASTGKLRVYIQALYTSFEFLLNFNNLLEILTDEKTEELIRILSAHIIALVFELKTLNKDSDTQQELEHLLQVLPEILENLHCQKSEGILLKVYNFQPIEKLKKPILDNFIHYAVGVFTYTDSPLEYPLLMNIFCIFHKCLVFNNEWQHLELLSDHLLNKYREMIKNLQHRQQQTRKSISKLQLENYNSLIKRLNILFKLKYELFDDSYLSFIHNLSGLFLHNTDMTFAINQNKSLIDIYVLEIIVSCFLKLIKKENKNNQNYNFLPEAQELFMYLWSTIKNLEEITKLPVVKIKTYFCCFIQLITNLPLKFENQIYHQLVQILIVVNFKQKFSNQKEANELQQLHPLQSLEYQHLMFRQFTEMHKYKTIQINTNMVWKLCIYYGMFRHNFQEDLKNLLITLGNYRFNIFKHIISVMIYNLYKQTPSLRQVTIVTILTQYKHLIDNDIKVIDSPQLLKVHVVLLVLQILAKALSVERIKTGHNRLEALRHLNIFIEDLNLDQLQAKQFVLEQLNEMKQHLMDVEETQLMTNFKQQLI